MTNEQALVFGILGAVLGLFAWGRLRHDVVALIALAAVAVTGLVSPDKLFEGFGHPAVITVMAVLILSHGLTRSGVVELIAAQLVPYTQNQVLHIVLLTGVVTVMSAFMNNVGALALMMPVALATAARHERPASILLMPLAFGAILGGMTTLIGTPPNIIVASFRADTAASSFALFDFTPVGLPVAVVGSLFVALIGWRLLPKERQAEDTQRSIFTIDGYLAELRVTEGSSFVGMPLREAGQHYDNEVKFFGIERGEHRLPAVGYRVLAAGDVMIVNTTPELLARLVDERKLEIVSRNREEALALDKEIDWRDANLLEVIISPDSPLIGRSARVVDRIFGRDVGLLALSRQGSTLRGRLRDQVFEPGDVALLQGQAETLNELVERFRMLPLAERGLAIGQKRDPWLSLGIFAGAIALGASGMMPISVAFIIAIIAFLVTGILPLRELYDGVDWPVIILLGAMFPIGTALESTGGTETIAQGIVSLAGDAGMPAWGVLTVVLVATMALSDVINNAATALLMAPISVQIANSLSVNADAFLMAVAVGASCAFLTPIGHQCNTLVMGPGGYKFTDYWRLGLPLEILIVVVAVPLLLTVWPL